MKLQLHKEVRHPQLSIAECFELTGAWLLIYAGAITIACLLFS